MALQTVIIGPGYLLGQSAARGFDPIILISLRTLAAALLMLPVFFALGGWRTFSPTRAQWRHLLMLALVGVVVNSTLFMLGLRYTTPANSALIYALTPALVLVLAVVVLRDERMNLAKALGVGIAVAGVVVLFTGQGRAFEGDLVLGNTLTLAAVCLWAAYLVLSRRWLSGLNPLQVPAAVLGLGALMLLPIGLLRLVQLEGEFMPTLRPAEAWGGLAYLVLVNSVASFLIIQFALTQLRASQVAIYMNLQPISAFAFSWVLGREHLSWGLALGSVLTIGGILLLNLAQNRLTHTAEG